MDKRGVLSFLKANPIPKKSLLFRDKLAMFDWNPPNQTHEIALEVPKIRLETKKDDFLKEETCF